MGCDSNVADGDVGHRKAGGLLPGVDSHHAVPLLLCIVDTKVVTARR